MVLTLLFSLSSSGQPAFAWDRIQGILETNRSSLPYSSFPFTFQAVGWTPADESIEEAIRRLRRDFGKTLSEHRAFWDMQQKLATILDALPERNKDHFRNIRWLAQKQACPDISLADLVGKKGVPSIQTVRRGIHAVAEFLGIPQEKIHRARSGRKPAGPR